VSVDRRVSLVTGTSSGFGWHIALALARGGDTVFAGMQYPAGRDTDSAQRIAQIAVEEGLDIRVVEVDVDHDASVEACVGQILSQAGRVDALVNNAGFGVLGPWECTDMEAARRQFETNFWGVFRMSRAVVPAMRDCGHGHILATSSEAGVSVVPGEAFYDASKFALEAMMRVMRLELSQFGIRVATVTPGWYKTEFLKYAVVAAEDGQVAQLYARLMDRFGETATLKDFENPDTWQFGDAVKRVLGMDDPPFRNTCNAGEMRMRAAGPDEAERDLVEYYELQDFYKPWLGAKGRR
jgi:NAD(P)-dependent dehydrogenase (short-subunit alcohol dehydrogenase family)